MGIRKNGTHAEAAQEVGKSSWLYSGRTFAGGLGGDPKSIPGKKKNPRPMLAHRTGREKFETNQIPRFDYTSSLRGMQGGI